MSKNELFDWAVDTHNVASNTISNSAPIKDTEYVLVKKDDISLLFSQIVKMKQMISESDKDARRAFNRDSG